jgi:hypothetical protein
MAGNWGFETGVGIARPMVNPVGNESMLVSTRIAFPYGKRLLIVADTTPFKIALTG